jgi:hypothetical protein
MQKFKEEEPLIRWVTGRPGCPRLLLLNTNKNNEKEEIIKQHNF